MTSFVFVMSYILVAIRFPNVCVKKNHREKSFDPVHLYFKSWVIRNLPFLVLIKAEIRKTECVEMILGWFA